MTSGAYQCSEAPTPPARSTYFERRTASATASTVSKSSQVQSLLKDFFNGKEPNIGINPDEAVAWSAPLHGGILSGEKGTDQVLFIDVCHLTLGIETTGGVFKDHPPQHCGNSLLDKFDLNGTPPTPRGAPQIEVSFETPTVSSRLRRSFAVVLERTKEAAKAYLGERTTHAFITVPGYFDDDLRKDTKDADTIAGLSILRIVSVPTAPANAYGLDEKNACGVDESHIIPYDFGGGTFDVSLLPVDDGVFEVLDTAGLRQPLLEHMTGADVSWDYRALCKLKWEVEKAKCTLSSQMSTRLEIESFDDGSDFSETLTRAELETQQ
ncbi:ATPase with role in protein import into the ER [Tulasnella sp. 424]|nr:ATPase with role in protein import into the ER [Tulasnella sp. 424]